MRITFALLSAFFYFVPTLAQSESVEYIDAKNVYAALGMMKLKINSAKLLHKECSAQFPSLKNEIDINLNIWRTVEASNITKTEYYWEKLQKNDPSLSSQIIQAEKIVKNNLASMKKPGNTTDNNLVINYCKRYFSDLASGIWRTRTPKAYFFLDKIK
jgi:hypothetical protein